MWTDTLPDVTLVHVNSFLLYESRSILRTDFSFRSHIVFPNEIVHLYNENVLGFTISLGDHSKFVFFFTGFI